MKMEKNGKGDVHHWTNILIEKNVVITDGVQAQTSKVYTSNTDLQKNI